MNKVTLRMKLSEFINTEYEEFIMEYIDTCHKRQPFFLHFWCNENEIDVDTINKFADTNKDKLHIRTVIKSTPELKANDFIWFDIIPHNIENSTYKRFSYSYTDKIQILNGLDEFYKVTKF